jgi:RimJ/RimL family protein N-acetyltransferase
MLDPSALIKASLEAGRDLFRAAPPEGGAEARAVQPVQRNASVPIRSLGPSHRERITGHLLALDERDRYLRFGYAANDTQIRRYADGLNFDRDDIFGIYNRKLELLAMAHLAFSVDPQFNTCAEFGVSVAKKARGRGYGGRLFERAVVHARNEGVSQLFIHALSENTAMLKIARRAGAVIERDGSESEAHLRLPVADFESRLSELVDEQLARTDSRVKAQARQFWQFLGTLQDIRRGVQEARDKSGS